MRRSRNVSAAAAALLQMSAAKQIALAVVAPSSSPPSLGSGGGRAHGHRAAPDDLRLPASTRARARCVREVRRQLGRGTGC